MGKNGDPHEGGSLRTEKFQGLICIVSDVGMPELVSAFRIIKGPHLRGES